MYTTPNEKGRKRNNTRCKEKRTREGNILFFKEIQLWGKKESKGIQTLADKPASEDKNDLPFM